MALKIEQLTFQVADIKFAKDGFHIVRTTAGDSVSGKFAARVGYCYKAVGRWEVHPVYGPAFKLDSAETTRMHTPEALGRFLSLQMKGKGVGDAVIGALVEACKTDKLDLEQLLDRSERDILVECVGSRNAKKIDKLLDIWPSIKPAADLISPLLGYGLSEAQAENLVGMYGASAVSVVEDDPYALILTLEGVSFLRADSIAMKVGRITKTDPVRLRAALSTGLRDATNNGDLGVSRKALVTKTLPLVNESVMENGRRKLAPGVPLVVSEERLEEVLSAMIAGQPLPGESSGSCGFASQLLEAPDEKGVTVVWYRPLIEAEKRIARRMSRFDAAPREDLVAVLHSLIAADGVVLAPEQLAALEMVLRNPVSVVTGGPGCGKSFILKLLMRTLDSAKLVGVMAAPTGKAAKRITESTGRKAQTQHSLIGFAPGGDCRHNESDPLEADYIVIDEASMDDTELMAATLGAVKDSCRVIIVGDVDQLPSVGPGQVLRDIIRSGVIPVTRLTKGHRFSGGIAEAARAVNRGEVPESSADGQFLFVETENPLEALLDAVQELRASGIRPDELQTLSPTNKGDAGCESLNRAMQRMFNPESQEHEALKLRRDNGDIFAGDRVIQVKNDKEIGLVNGDVGWVDSLTEDLVLALSLADRDKPVMLTRQSSQHLKLAYAITVHKSQGAEAPVVLIALDGAAVFMLRRSLVYTAITRGIKHVRVFSSRRVMLSAVRRGEPPEGSRRTTLVSKLRAAFPSRVPGEFTPAKVDLMAEAMKSTVQDIPF